MSELQGLQTAIDRLRDEGVEVLAISSDDGEDALRVAAKEELGYPVLADPDLEVIDAYGVRHEREVIDENGARYEDVEMFGNAVARPAVFLIDEAGVVRWRFVTDNWRVRVRPEQVLAAARELGTTAPAPAPSS